MKEHTIASRIVATCCAAAVACAAAICALTTRDAVAAPTDSASGSIAITYQHKSNDGADSNAGTVSAKKELQYQIFLTFVFYHKCQCDNLIFS